MGTSIFNPGEESALSGRAATFRQLPVAGLPAEQSATSSETQRAARRPIWLVPPVLTLAVILLGIGGASYSRDEAATMSAVQRPFHGLLRMLGHVDAVHGAYYVFLWPIVRVFGPGELATRLPSALAMAVAAWAIFGIGQRLVSERAGLFAGLVFAIVPQVDLYGQTARPYAMAVALAAVASYLLVRAIQVAAAGHKRQMYGWLVAYGVCLATLGYMHIFGLLLAAAHLVPVVRNWMRTGRNGGWLALTWAAVVLAALVSVGPFIMAGKAQDGTALGWVQTVNIGSLGTLVNLIGPPWMAAAAGLAVLCGVGVSGIGGRARLRSSWPGDLISLCLPWLIVPALILFVASQLMSPIYVFRYVMFCAPAAALLVGVGLSALGWRAGTAALAVIVALALPALLQVRTAGGHGDDIRRADWIVARNLRPGDALVYQTFNEPIQMAYPYGLQRLTNADLSESPSQSGTLGGTWAPLSVVQERLRRARRVWLVQLASGAHPTSPGPAPKVLGYQGFREARTWHTIGIWLTLFVRA